MNAFNLLKAPLKGIQLIEAGAGTGKTFNIAGLFVRLIVERGFTIDQILVVTYTKAATEELKSRIRNRLVTEKNELNTKLKDQLIEATVKDRIDPDVALQRIQDALTDFDRAAIFTIHGFCQRILIHFAFETGYLFEAKLLQDDQPMVQEMADDFWRRYIAPAPHELVARALEDLSRPEEMAALFNRCRTPGMRVVPDTVEPPLDALEAWRVAADQVCRAWPAAKDAVLKLLASEGLNATWYGKCQPDKGHPGVSPRERVLSVLAARMEQWEGRYPLFSHFDRFTTSLLEKATKKNAITPRHPFFDLCEHATACLAEMEVQISAYLRYLKVSLIKEARQRLDEKKSDRSVLFYDDLLIQVHRALQHSTASRLVRALRESYRAALVDEFQDTDALQYDIFMRLFGDEHALLFMIGDPKQAIYSFRGADLFSYLEAKGAASHQYTLSKNWRATQPLLNAINTLFDCHPQPFGNDQIGYEPAVAAHPDNSAIKDAPLQLWYLTRGDEAGAVRPLSQDEATRQIVAGVAEEIVTLLKDSQTTTVVEPQAIAVLTRTHQQAQSVKSALDERNVPAVLHSAGSVFDTREAESLSILLDAVAMPSDPFRVRAALATDLIGATADELCSSVETPAADWETRWGRFDGYHRIWMRDGFYPMFSRMMTEENIKRRVLARPDGERCLTNLLHLAELLHQASMESASGPEGLLAWFDDQRFSGSQGEDAQKLRLESDARAVQIITIHKSKGLQFDVVFCPFVWSGARVDKKSVTFHDPQAEGQLTLSIGPDIDPSHSELALREALAENIRLLYVAITRARKRCYMAWGCIKGTEISAPAYLLHGARCGDLTEEGVSGLRRNMAAMDDARLLTELKQVEAQAGGSIRVKTLPSPTGARYSSSEMVQKTLAERRFHGVVDKEWRITSFSSLTAGAGAVHDADGADRDAHYMDEPTVDSEKSDDVDLFAFPRGAKAGLFFHDLIEHVDFANRDEVFRGRLVADKLNSHRFDVEWSDAVERMLVRLGNISIPIKEAGGHFCLSDVPWHRRINEMEFHYPIKRLEPDTLAHIFQAHGRPFVQQMPSHHWQRLNFSPVHGFMKGFIDMIFEHGGRYYLVDWKSNHLGNAYKDYAPESIEAAMTESFYYLQYHLYVIALDQWLQNRIAGYRYDQHFGGVLYFFIRGIDGAGKSNGIFYDRPNHAVVTRLKEALIGN